jgi:ribosomal subunit interface protein
MIISAKNFKLTPSIKTFVEQKLQGLEHLSRVPVNGIKIRLDFDRNQLHGNIFRAELSCTWHGRTFKAGEKAEDMRIAIDTTVQKLERQLRNAKDRLLSKRVGHHQAT